MVKNRALVAAMFLANFGACASTGVAYKYYVVHPEVTPPMLYGSKPSEDLDLLKTCSPDPECAKPDHPKTANCGKCIGMVSTEFFKMKQELLELRQAVSDCQQGPHPSVPLPVQ